jgi:hypothetical protein
MLHTLLLNGFALSQGVALLPLVLVYLVVVAIAGFGPALDDPTAPLVWLERDRPALPFVALSLWLFAGCAIFGVQRLLTAELQVQGLPWAGSAFTLMLAVYLGGFASGGAGAWWQIAAAVGVVLSYLFALSGRIDAVALRRLLQPLSDGLALRHRAMDVPVWAPVLLLAALLCIGASLAPLAEGNAGWPAWTPAVLWLLAVRDIGLLHFFALGAKPRGAPLAWMVYLWVLYFLIPGLLRLTDTGTFGAFLFPSWFDTDRIAASLAGALLHVLVVALLLRWRWRRRFAPADAPV